MPTQRIGDAFDAREFEDIQGSVGSEDHAWLTGHYALDKDTGRYVRRGGDDLDLQRTWRIVFPYYQKYANTDFMAHCLQKRRCRWGRDTDARDDHYKAEYLGDLLDFWKRWGIVVPLREEQAEFEEALDTVFHVYDGAYFRKRANPSRSDLDCFAEAEREFIPERRQDHETAETKRTIAYRLYELRQRWKRHGSPADDYLKAEYVVRQLLDGRPAVATWRDEGMVFNIYDRAYFTKLANPTRSDLECFAEAEGHYRSAPAPQDESWEAPPARSGGAPPHSQPRA